MITNTNADAAWGGTRRPRSTRCLRCAREGKLSHLEGKLSHLEGKLSPLAVNGLLAVHQIERASEIGAPSCGRLAPRERGLFQTV